jgi:SRSO17 transposase
VTLPAKENPMQEKVPPLGWEGELERWLAPFLAVLNREAQRRWAPVYLKGLLLPGERKSVEPLAARVAPGSTEQLHHFIGGSPWATEPLEAILTKEADRLVGGPDAVLVVDDTALPKQGKHSVGVARQYCGCSGKRANCQVLVSLTLARGEVPVPVGLRLFLPAAWTDDPERCARAGVPEGRRRALAKTEIALAEIDRLLAADVRFGWVVTDAGYGISAAFRKGLSERGLTWAVGIPKVQNVYPSGVELGWPVARTGRPRKHPVPSEAPVPAGAMLEDAGWRRIAWRRGTKRGRSRPSSPPCGCGRRRGRSSGTAGTCPGTRSGSWVSGAPPASASTTCRTCRPTLRSRPWPR